MTRFPSMTLLFAATWLATGCATTLSTMDTARTTPVGHVRMDAATGLFIPTGPLVDILGAGDRALERLTGGNDPLPAEEAQKLYDAALSLSLMPPAALQEVMIRTGVMEDMDVGLRLATTSLRADVKYRFFHSGTDNEASKHASVGLGASRYMFGGVVFDVLEWIKIDDFSRWDFELPVLYSWEYKQFFTFHAGAKYVYTRFSLDPNFVELQNRLATTVSTPRVTDQVDSNMHFLGGLAGISAGYKYVFVMLELTAGYSWARPSVYSFIDGQTSERNLGGVTLYPSIGLVLKV